MTRSKPAAVRYYFDADVLGLAQTIARLRPDVTYPGDPGGVVHKRHRAACPITDPKTPDPIWIPAVTRPRWLIVTRDSKIQDHRAEIRAVRDAGARMIALTGPEAKGTWSQLEILMSNWRRIEQKLDEDGPFIYALTRTNLRLVPLA